MLLPESESVPLLAQVFWHLSRGIYTVGEGLQNKGLSLSGILITLSNLTEWQNKSHSQNQEPYLRLAPNYLRTLQHHGSCLPIWTDALVVKEEHGNSHWTYTLKQTSGILLRLKQFLVCTECSVIPRGMKGDAEALEPLGLRFAKGDFRKSILWYV